MTEPPTPPGSDDPGEEDREFDEFFASEQFAELEDDILLDQVGEGDDTRTFADDLALSDEDHDLQDMLFDAHDAVTEEPVPELVSTDDAMKIIADAKKKHDEEAAAKRSRENPDNGGTADMTSAGGLAEQVEGISTMGDVQHSLQEAAAIVSRKLQELSELLQGTAHLGAVEQSGGELAAAIAAADSLMGSFTAAILAAAAAIKGS